MDDVQAAEKDLNAGEEALLRAQAEHVEAARNVAAANAALAKALYVSLGTTELTQKKWRYVALDNAENVECLQELLFDCYVLKEKVKVDTLLTNVDFVDDSKTLEQLMYERPDLRKIVGHLQNLKQAGEAAAAEHETRKEEVLKGQLKFVGRLLRLRMLKLGREHWRQQLDDGSLHGSAVTPKDVHTCIQDGDLQGRELFVPAGVSGTPKSAWEMASTWKESTLAALLLESYTGVADGAANFDPANEKCWTYTDAYGVAQGPFSASQLEQWVLTRQWQDTARLHHKNSENKVMNPITSILSVVATVRKELHVAQHLPAQVAAAEKVRRRLPEDMVKKKILTNVVCKLLDDVLLRWLADRKAGRLAPPRPPAQPPAHPPASDASAGSRAQEPAAFPALREAAQRANSAAGAVPGWPRPSGGVPSPVAAAHEPAAQVSTSWHVTNGGAKSAAQLETGVSRDNAAHDMEKTCSGNVHPSATQQNYTAPVSGSLNAAPQSDGASWEDAAREMDMCGPGSPQGGGNGSIPALSQGRKRSRKSRWGPEHTPSLENGGLSCRANLLPNNAAGAEPGEQKGPKRARNGEMHSHAAPRQRHTDVLRNWDLQNGQASPGRRGESPANDLGSPGRPAVFAPEQSEERELPPEVVAPAPAPEQQPEEVEWPPEVAAVPAPQAAGSSAGPAGTAHPADQASVVTPAALPVVTEQAVQTMGSSAGGVAPEKQDGSPAAVPNGRPAGQPGKLPQKPGEAAPLQRSCSGTHEPIKFTPSPRHAPRKNVFDWIERPVPEQPVTLKAPVVWAKEAPAWHGSAAIKRGEAARSPEAAAHAATEQNGSSPVQLGAGADDNATGDVPHSSAMGRAAPDQALPAETPDLPRSEVSGADYKAAEAAEALGYRCSAGDGMAAAAENQAAQEQPSGDAQPSDACGGQANGSQLPPSGMEPHRISAVWGGTAALPSPAAATHLETPSASVPKKAAAAAAAFAEGAGSDSQAASAADAQRAAVPETPAALDAAAAVAGGSGADGPSAAQPDTASPAEQNVFIGPFKDAAGLLTSASGAAAAAGADVAANADVAAGADAKAAAAYLAAAQGAADPPAGAAESEAAVPAQPRALPTEVDQPLQLGDSQPPPLPTARDENGVAAHSSGASQAFLEERAQEHTESVGAADMDVEISGDQGLEGTPQVPDGAATAAGAAAASLEAGAGSASGKIMHAVEGKRAKNRVLVGERDGKPLFIDDYTEDEWREAFQQMKALLIELGMEDRIIQPGAPIPTGDMSDEESDTDEDADRRAGGASGRVAKPLPQGALRELMGLMCDVERQPLHKDRKAAQPPPQLPPQPKPKPARSEKPKHASLKAKALKPQRKPAAVQKLQLSKPAKRTAKTARRDSEAEQNVDYAAPRAEDVCSRVLPLESVSRKSALAEQARQAAVARVAAQPAAAVEGRAGRLQARQLARSEVTQDLATWQKLQGRADDLRLGKSGVHMWGLFARKPIPSNEFIIEYVGELIRRTVNDVRERMDADSDYRFRVDADWVVDATRRGGKARFINHSCDPNCVTKTVSVGGQLHIMIYSKRPIPEGKELTYDYKFQPTPGETPIPCTCGAKNCRRRLN